MNSSIIGQRPFDLPLESTAASRFLPWIIAVLVYVAVVALGVAAIADRALNVYGMRARLVTLTIPAAEDATASERDLERALGILNDTAGVTSATPVAPDELKELIEPWLGDRARTADLPLPRLIDVTFDSAAQLDLAALQSELREAVPGATLGIEAMSRNRAERLASFVRGWGLTLGLVVLLASLAAVYRITRLSLDLHAETVELLRFMGAPDPYVARQFERHALFHAIKGGLFGFIAALLTLLVVIWTSRRMELAGAIDLGLSAVDWILLACIPVIAILAVTAVARVTALWALGRMP